MGDFADMLTASMEALGHYDLEDYGFAEPYSRSSKATSRWQDRASTLLYRRVVQQTPKAILLEVDFKQHTLLVWFPKAITELQSHNKALVYTPVLHKNIVNAYNAQVVQPIPNEPSITTVKQEQKKMNEVNVKSVNALTFIQEGTFFTVSVSFLKDASNRKYTYKVRNDLKDMVEVGTLLIVDTDTGYKIVEVKEVHEFSKIDYSVNYEYKWAVDIIHDAWYTMMREKEKKAKWDMMQAELRAKLENEVGDTKEAKARWGF